MKSAHGTRLFRLLACASLALPGQLPAQTSGGLATEEAATPVERARHAGVVTIYYENDYFGGTDENYTNGAKISWLSADLSAWGRTGWQHGLLTSLPFVNQADTQKNFGISLGQQIYTPTDTVLVNPDPSDRPYAGWSYFELSFISKNSSRADIVSIQLGILGPSSWAEKTQRTVHDAIGADTPSGWDYQLGDEPGINLIYERRYRAYARAFGDALGFDFIPVAGVSLGNVQTFANLGAQVRIGLNLPTDFGVQLARGGAIGAGPGDDLDPRVAVDRSFSIFVFAGADGRAVAQDIFLDGNTWRDSRSVDKNTFVADVQSGVGIIWGAWQLTGAYVARSKEFETQPEPWTSFASVTLSVAY